MPLEWCAGSGGFCVFQSVEVVLAVRDIQEHICDLSGQCFASLFPHSPRIILFSLLPFPFDNFSFLFLVDLGRAYVGDSDEHPCPRHPRPARLWSEFGRPQGAHMTRC